MHITPSTIIVVVMLTMAITPIMYAAYRWANQWDTDTCAIKGMIRYTPTPTTVTVYPSIGDPSPFNHESDLHMMLVNDLATYIQEDK